MSLTPKNWSSFQHYKDRSPAWIKLHRGLLDDFAFSKLPVASRALAPLLWLLASEGEDGKITGSIDEIAFRLRMPEKELAVALKPLIDGGFFSDDSATLASRKHTAIPEREEEEQEKIEEEKKLRPVASATRTANDSFVRFWKAYPRRKGGNSRHKAEQQFLAAVKRGVDPEIIIRAIVAKTGFDPDKIGTEYIPHAVKWLSDRRWEQYQEGDGFDEGQVKDAEELMRTKGYDFLDGRWQKVESNEGRAA